MFSVFKRRAHSCKKTKTHIYHSMNGIDAVEEKNKRIT